MIKRHFAFISRHAPTPEQYALAWEQNITLHVVGDLDAFTVTIGQVEALAPEGVNHFDGVVVVHPAAALRLVQGYDVGVFENGQRAAEDGKPSFFAKSLTVYKNFLSLVDDEIATFKAEHNF